MKGREYDIPYEMKWQIQTYHSVGPFQLGKKRADMRQVLSKPPEVQAMTETRPPLDAYVAEGIYIAYDKFDVSGAIELKAPAQAIFQNKNLLQLPYTQALAWFQELDPDTEEDKEHFVSWKHGILFHAPQKETNPETIADTITVFREDFFNVKHGIPDPADVNSFHIHVAHVEPVSSSIKNFENIQTALGTIFSNNREEGFLIWNGIPIPFSYSQDLPNLLTPFLDICIKIQDHPTGSLVQDLVCDAFSSKWEIQWDEKFLKISSQWSSVSGGYESALNQEICRDLLVLKKEFLTEWKLLFKQCNEAIQESRVKISQDGARPVEKLKKVERSISAFGKFYQKEREVFSTDFEGRKIVQLKNLPKIAQGILVILILSFVVIPVWFLSKDKDSPFWFWENISDILLFVVPFILIAAYVGLKMIKAWRE